MSTPTITQAKPKRLTVKLVEFEPAENYDLQDLVNSLRKRVSWLSFKFERLPLDRVPDDEQHLLQIDKTSPYWDWRKVLKLLKSKISAGPDEYVIAITPNWIADCPEPDSNGDTPAVGYADAYFGIYHNNFVRLDPDEIRYALISTAPWEARYEKAAYRTVQQYIVHMVTAAIGDYVVEAGLSGTKHDYPGLTHGSYQSCVFDYTDFPDSIVSAVQRSRICRQCVTRLENYAVLRLNLKSSQLEAGLNKLLDIPRRPTYFQVLRALHENPLFSLFILGILLSFIVGLGIDFLSKNHWTESLAGVAAFSACILALLAVIWFMRAHLTGRTVR